MDETQKGIAAEFESHFGWEMMSLKDVDSPQSFLAIWDMNIQWLRDRITEGGSFINDYRNKWGE